MYNYPYMNPYSQNNQQIIRVNGENGARAFQMMPNSSTLLLDETEARLFLAQTDGAGYKTITAYKLEPYQAPVMNSYESLAERISKLEGIINGKSYSGNGTQAKRNQQDSSKS